MPRTGSSTFDKKLVITEYEVAEAESEPGPQHSPAAGQARQHLHAHQILLISYRDIDFSTVQQGSLVNTY